MILLVLVSLLWGLSFGLIKAEVSTLDPFLVSALRLGLCALAFAPFLRRVPGRLALMALGALQFGAMYSAYIAAYRNLAGHEVAILTVSTPVFVVLTDAALSRRLRPNDGVAALLAIGGALVIAIDPAKAFAPALVGVGLVQLANLCFGAGQVLYLRARGQSADHRALAWMYLGAVLVPLSFVLLRAPVALPERASQWWSLAYLGLVPSGLGFFLWNKGVGQVRPAVAAAMNNAKIPAAVVLAALLFGEAIEVPRVGASLALLIAAVLVARR